MTYRVTALIFLIGTLLAGPIVVMLLAIALPRFPSLLGPALMVLAAILTVSFLLPLSGWRSRAIVVAIPLSVFAMPASFLPSYVLPSLLIISIAMHSAFLIGARPGAATRVEPVMWGLLLSFLTLFYLVGPTLQLYLWLQGHGWISQSYSLGPEDLIFGVLAAAVCFPVFLRSLISRELGDSNKGFNADAGKAGAG